MNLPLVIVLSRALATLPTCALLAVGQRDADAAALALFVLAALSDIADGHLARARREVTALGAALDPLADKILVVGVLTALALRGLVPVWALGVILAREVVAVGVRGAASRPLPATNDGKLKTVAQVIAAAAVILAAALGNAELARGAGALVMAAVALTVLSGVRLILRAAQATADAR